MRKLLMASIAALMMAAVAIGVNGPAHPMHASGKTITIGNIGWDEDIAVSNLTKVLLEQDLGYSNVKLPLADVGILFEGVASGDLQAFQDVWMPNHALYLNRAKAHVQMLNPWFVGVTKFSMAAPSYMHIKSISQINSSGAKEIYGIEPGAVITDKIRKNVIPEYHIKAQFLPSSTPAMLATVARAYKAHQPFIFIAWSPHWMNHVYNFNYLSDPKGALGALTHPSRVSSIVHKGLNKTDPEAYTLIKSLRLTAEQVNAIEFDIKKAGTSDPTQGVKVWLAKNKNVVMPWVNAAKKAK